MNTQITAERLRELLHYHPGAAILTLCARPQGWRKVREAEKS